MVRDYKSMLIDMMWRYRRDLFVNLLSTESKSIEIQDFGFESDNRDIFDYEAVSIVEDGVVKKGGVKFFDTYKQYNRWKDANPLSSRVTVLVLCSDMLITKCYSEDFAIVLFDIKEELSRCYYSLSYSNTHCANLIASFDTLRLESIFTRLVIERLETKEMLLRKRFEEFNNDINELLLFTFFDTLYISTKNQEPMRELYRAIKRSEVLRLLSTSAHYEALILGCSGLLDSVSVVDDYFVKLRKIYLEISSKFALKSIGAYRWDFKTPSPNQTLWMTLSHFASLLYTHKDLLFRVVDIKDYSDAIALFDVPLDEYWLKHRYPAKSDKELAKDVKFSKVRKSGMIVNGIVPFLFFYQKEYKYGDYNDSTEILLDILICADKESHSYTRMWTREGVVNRNAFDSQALTQLGKCYCKDGMCPKCPIGISILLSTI